LKLAFDNYYFVLGTIAFKFAIGLYKLVAMIFAVSFEIIIQRAVGNESCYPMKNTLSNYQYYAIGVEKKYPLFKIFLRHRHYLTSD
jgi:hypothetical protein